MNILKTSIAASVFSLAAITAASAQTTIVITGSTAYRGPTTAAIQNVLTAGYTVGFTGTSLSGANAQIFKGNIGTNSVIIKTSWSGSAAGVQTVAATSPTKTVGTFATTTTTSVLPGTSGISDPRSGANQERPDIAMSDTFQSASLFNGTYLGVSYAGLTEATPAAVGAPSALGIIPFKWVATASAPVGLNMTPQFATAIYTTVGAAPLALLTGNSLDQGTTVYGLGRDPDSGTRITAFSETGIGANTAVQQFKPAASAGAFTSLSLYPATTINGVPVVAGNSGESSGGTLAGFFGNTGPVGVAAPLGDGFGVTYLSTGDAATATGLGGKDLTYNGATYSVAAVQQGKYTFWSYAHMYYRSSPGAVVKSVADQIASNIYSTTATIALTSMSVSRAVDGGTVTATYF